MKSIHNRNYNADKAMNKFVLFILIATAVSCNQEPTFENKIDSIFSESFSSDGPGGAVLIMKGEKIVFEIYKRLNTNNQHKMTAIPVCLIPKY